MKKSKVISGFILDIFVYNVSTKDVVSSGKMILCFS